MRTSSESDSATRIVTLWANTEGMSGEAIEPVCRHYVRCQPKNRAVVKKGQNNIKRIMNDQT